jgi:serine/threonine protein kinase
MSHRTPASAFETDSVLLEKYRVVRVIGSGGYGAVLEAENLRTTRRVAIKVLHGESLARPSTAMKRLHNEARAAAMLSHPNSVDVLDLERDADGTLYFVQELLEGESLFNDASSLTMFEIFANVIEQPNQSLAHDIQLIVVDTIVAFLGGLALPRE